MIINHILANNLFFVSFNCPYLSLTYFYTTHILLCIEISKIKYLLMQTTSSLIHSLSGCLQQAEPVFMYLYWDQIHKLWRWSSYSASVTKIVFPVCMTDDATATDCCLFVCLIPVVLLSLTTWVRQLYLGLLNSKIILEMQGESFFQGCEINLPCASSYRRKPIQKAYHEIHVSIFFFLVAFTWLFVDLDFA